MSPKGERDMDNNVHPPTKGPRGTTLDHEGLLIDLTKTWKKISGQGKDELFESVTDVCV